MNKEKAENLLQDYFNHGSTESLLAAQVCATLAVAELLELQNSYFENVIYGGNTVKVTVQ